MGEIVNDLMVSLKAHLLDKMVDNIPAKFATALTYMASDGLQYLLKPSVIRIGRLQDDPTELSDSPYEPSLLVAIHGNDPDDMSDGWEHKVAGAYGPTTEDAPSVIPAPHEIGGSRAWWRRLKVTWEMYLIDSDQNQEEATRLANLLRALLEWYCTSLTVGNPYGWNCVMSDDFGEYAYQANVVKCHAWEGGGPEDDYIWRGGVWVQVETMKEGTA